MGSVLDELDRFLPLADCDRANFRVLPLDDLAQRTSLLRDGTQTHIERRILNVFYLPSRYCCGEHAVIHVKKVSCEGKVVPAGGCLRSHLTVLPAPYGCAMLCLPHPA
ncbi:MAG: hypothetical protein IJU37_00330 [Desulfovibrio sp.]|nr:hypothetical protein [Desulfovibrio sp.]